MLPKEHGAYGQLSFPLATAFAVAGITPPALLTAVAAVAGFLAHEPLLVLAGRRGARAQRTCGRRARKWLGTTVSVAIAAGSAALWLAPADARWAFLFPLLPVAVLVGELIRGREKSALGEIAAATAFSFVAIPVCVTAGTSVATAVSVGIAFACLFAASTLGVRVLILKVRGGGNPVAMRVTRLSVVAMVLAVVVLLAIAGSLALLPWTTLLAVIPGLVVALTLGVCPPAASRLRTVGWVLVSISAAAGVILFVGLGG